MNSPEVPPRKDARLLVTAHFVRSARVGGAEHMLYNLLNGLAPGVTRLSVLCGERRFLNPSFVEELQALRSAEIIETGGAGSRFVAEQRACLDPAVGGDAILFSNYFVPPVLPKRIGRSTVILHDLQYRHFPEHFSPKKRLWLRAVHNFSIRRADTMVVISDFVRNDVIRWFGKSAERKLAVIPNPISWDRFGPPTGNRPIERPYILSVSAQYPHKNLEILVRAFARLCGSNSDVMLVLCGQDYTQLSGVAPRRAALGTLVTELGIRDRIVSTGYVDDLSLGNWYRHAVGFAFPSLFEGFGMPVVEALGFGLPTVLTGCTALPESSLGLGTQVQDPTSVAEWTTILTEMIRNPAAFRPAEQDTTRLRQHYHPARIAARYLETCLP